MILFTPKNNNKQKNPMGEFDMLKRGIRVSGYIWPETIRYLSSFIVNEVLLKSQSLWLKSEEGNLYNLKIQKIRYDSLLKEAQTYKQNVYK